MPATVHARARAERRREPVRVDAARVGLARAPEGGSAGGPQETPEELAVRAQGGSAEAFERLVVMFETRLFNFLLRRVSAAEAEDVAQEAFIRAWEKIGQYSPRWRFSTWLFTIATRQASSRLRSARRSASMENVRPGVRVDVSERIVRGEVRGRVWGLVDEIGEEQRTAVWLRYVEELSMQEIAQVMGKSQVGVRVMLHRARLELAKRMQESGAAEELGFGVGLRAGAGEVS